MPKGGFHIKKLTIIIIVVALVFSLPACVRRAYGQPMEPVRTETIEFDLETAVSMIEPGDRLIADLDAKSVVSRQEFEAFITKISEYYGGFAEPNWENMLFYYKEDDMEETIRVIKDIFFPTVFHQGFEVTSALIVKDYYEDQINDYSILTIRLEYVGEQESLRGWYRHYNYRQDDAGNWVFRDFDGAGNFILEHKGLNPGDIKLK